MKMKGKNTMNRSVSIVILVLCVLTVSLPFSNVSHAGEGYTISWFVIAGGGGRSVGGAYAMDVTIGQPEAGAMSGGEYELAGGYWHPVESITPPCFADLDGSGAVDSGDLLQVLGAWGECVGCPQDLNGDGVVDSQDLLSLLGVWGPCS